MLFDLDTERDHCFAGPADAPGELVGEAFDLVTGYLHGLEPAAAIRETRRFKARLSAVETAKVAQLTAETGDDRAAKKALNDGKTSKSVISKAAARGAVAGKNPDLIDKVADSDLSEEHLDVIAETDAKPVVLLRAMPGSSTMLPVLTLIRPKASATSSLWSICVDHHGSPMIAADGVSELSE